MSATHLEPIYIPISDAPYAPVKRRVSILDYTPAPTRAVIELTLRVEHYNEIEGVTHKLPSMDWNLKTRSDESKMVDMTGALLEADPETGGYPEGAIPEVHFIWSLLNGGTYTNEQVAGLFVQRMDSRDNFNQQGLAFV